ncbi:MAG: hypothetical protein DDT19_00056 [Syntrophomonadaceae bacterium]|nr:hypothetical protein [Bacillota bacterium]
MYRFTIFGSGGHQTLLLEKDQALAEFDKLIKERMIPLTPEGDILKELPEIPAETLEVMWLRQMQGGYDEDT